MTSEHLALNVRWEAHLSMRELDLFLNRLQQSVDGVSLFGMGQNSALSRGLSVQSGFTVKYLHVTGLRAKNGRQASK